MSSGVVIIGGGAIGFAIAYFLAKEGIDSEVIEMESIAAKASGASMGNISSAAGGVLYLGSWAPRDVLKASIEIEQETYNRMKNLCLQLQDETGIDIRYADRGGLFCTLSESEETFVKRLVNQAHSIGLPAQWLTGDEVRKNDELLTDEVRGAGLIDYAQVDAYRYTLALAQGAERLGSSIILHEATGLNHNGKRVTSVRLNKREIPADILVVAMGPWSVRVNSWLGASIPIRPVRAQSFMLRTDKLPKRRTGFTPPASQWPGKGPGRLHISLVPRPDGSLIGGYSEDWATSWQNNRPETWDDRPTEEMKDAIIEGCTRLYPHLTDARVAEPMCGMLGYPQDDIPIIGLLPGWENVYMATGFGTTGITMSITTARFITDFISGGERAKKATEETRPFSPGRFIQRY